MGRMARKKSGGRGGTRMSSGGKGRAWHTTSFLAGLLLGAAGALLVTQAPDGVSEQVASLQDSADFLPYGGSEELTFTFDDLLRNSEVPSDLPPPDLADGAQAEEEAAPPPSQPRPPAAPPKARAEARTEENRAPPAAQPRRFQIQAASFRRVEDAEQLRAKLMLQALPAQTARVELASGAWHRVIVGPIESEPEAKRVMNLLREQKLAAMWIKRG